ncbi:MAG: hypothetical protein RL172_39 [Bacteroidota bacterium]|jgi:two-component system, NtrC family, sensor kinase
MVLQSVLALILLNHLRKIARASALPASWRQLLMLGTCTAIALIAIYYAVPGSKPLVALLTLALQAALHYVVFTKKQFSQAKPLTYAFLPVVVVNLLHNLVKFIGSDFFEGWNVYFGAAELFALIWMVAMLIFNNKQAKKQEKERLKNEEKERALKITEQLKAELEVQVQERTAQITQQKEALEHTLNELKSTQAQLIQSEKMASLGELTAGIAHEIQNPLNFVNNFSEVSEELIKELVEEMEKGNAIDVKAIAADLVQNLQKINHHGKRADAIVKGMLQHSRSSTGVKEPADVNALADEYLRLAYHGLRAKDKSFNAGMKTNFDTTIGNINIVPQDIGRVILNLITNAFYAVTEKKKTAQAGSYEPVVTVTTKKINKQVQIIVSDNGNGIPQKMIDKIFQPFFTTKPTGQGTGLGLSMSYDIVTKAHAGQLTVTTVENEGASFTITLPA